MALVNPHGKEKRLIPLLLTGEELKQAVAAAEGLPVGVVFPAVAARAAAGSVRPGRGSWGTRCMREELRARTAGISR